MDNKRVVDCLLEQIKCLIDVNEFIRHLSKGEMNVQVPGRYNFYPAISKSSIPL